MEHSEKYYGPSHLKKIKDSVGDGNRSQIETVRTMCCAIRDLDLSLEGEVDATLWFGAWCIA